MGRSLLWLALCLVAVRNVSGAGKPPWCTLKPAQFAKCKKFGGCCGEISKTSKMSKCVLFGTCIVPATAAPTRAPTKHPTKHPTPAPPTPRPTGAPTHKPTPSPTPSPTPHPTSSPTHKPTPGPTATPTPSPTPSPTQKPTPGPTPPPTPHPTASPTSSPTASPTPNPTRGPTGAPTPAPPTHAPTVHPTPVPTHAPTHAPTDMPTPAPTRHPTKAPTPAPPTPAPTPPGCKLPRNQYNKCIQAGGCCDMTGCVLFGACKLPWWASKLKDVRRRRYVRGQFNSAQKTKVDLMGNVMAQNPVSCPKNCMHWFDGCNVCKCDQEHRVTGCTKHSCMWRSTWKCVMYDSIAPPNPAADRNKCAKLMSRHCGEQLRQEKMFSFIQCHACAREHEFPACQENGLKEIEFVCDQLALKAGKKPLRMKSERVYIPTYMHPHEGFQTVYGQIGGCLLARSQTVLDVVYAMSHCRSFDKSKMHPCSPDTADVLAKEIRMCCAPDDKVMLTDPKSLLCKRAALPILGRVETEIRRTFAQCVRNPDSCHKYAHAYQLCAMTTRRYGKTSFGDPACVQAFGVVLPVYKQLLSAAADMYHKGKKGDLTPAAAKQLHMCDRSVQHSTKHDCQEQMFEALDKMTACEHKADC
jgi:hypothetical protein